LLGFGAKDNTQSPNQTRYQLTSHLQSNTLELDDKAQTLSFAIGIKVGGGLLGFGATVVAWVDGEGLLPCATVCLV
jgi:hypothetical protein